jgi:flagellar hook-associated protein 2
MSSPITLTGFNNIDWSSVLEALMQQESQPLTALQTQQSVITAQQAAFTTFATKLGTLESAVTSLKNGSTFNGRAVTNSNTAALSASVTSGTPIGTYDVLVTELARAQVTGTTSTHTDADTTVVASGGTLTIGGKTVTIAAGVTLQGLATAINGTADIGVTASVVRNGSNYQIALTGNETGASHAFTITNNLTGGSGVAFSGTNAQSATDAAGTVNGIAFTSTTNQVTGAVPGATLTLVRKDPINTVVLTITGDTGTVKDSLQKFVTAYNDVVKFIDAQQAAAGRKETNNIGRDSLVRGLRSQLSRVLVGQFGSAGTFNAISQAGLSLQRDGTLSLDTAAFDAAVSRDAASVQKLFTGDGTTGGVFQSLLTSIQSYTKSDGLVSTAQTRLDAASSRLAGRIDDMTNQLALKRSALQKDMIAADQAIASLNRQASSLSSLSSQYSLF